MIRTAFRGLYISILLISHVDCFGLSLSAEGVRHRVTTGDWSQRHGHRHNSLFGRHVDIDDFVRLDDGNSHLLKRQEPSPSSPGTSSPTVTSTPPPSEDETPNGNDVGSFNEITSAACLRSLTALNGKSSSPSGMSVCYNLPFLDQATGVFQAELRIYNVSAPVDDWIGVRTADMMVGLTYSGATVQLMGRRVVKRDLIFPQLLVKRQEQEGDEETDNGTPRQIKVLTYVGRIDRNLLSSAVDESELQTLVVPTILLTARRPSDDTALETALSSTEASFVNGAFSESTGVPSSRIASSSLSSFSTSAPIDSSQPGELPGVTLGIFPIGMLITLAWSALLMGAVGLGTLRKLQFRTHYRHRIRRDIALGVGLG